MKVLSGNSAPVAPPAARAAAASAPFANDRDAFARVLVGASTAAGVAQGMAGQPAPSAGGEAAASGPQGTRAPATAETAADASEPRRTGDGAADVAKTSTPPASAEAGNAGAEDDEAPSAKDALANGTGEAGRKAQPEPHPAAADAAVNADAPATIPPTTAATEGAAPSKAAAEAATHVRAEAATEPRQADQPESARKSAPDNDAAPPSVASRSGDDAPRHARAEAGPREAAAAKAAVASAQARSERAAASASAAAPAMEQGLRTEQGDKSARGSQRMETVERLLRATPEDARTVSSEVPKAASEKVAMPRALARELASLLAQRGETASIRLSSEAGASSPSASTTVGGFSSALGGVSAMAGGAAQSAPAATAGGGQPLPSGPPQQLAEMASRVLVDAASEGNWRVTLRLDPPEMGRLDVQISREQGALTAHFVASTAGARAAMEQAMPMLEAQMAEQGMSLADSSVSQQHSGGNGRDQSSENDQGASAGWGDGGGEPLVTNGATVRRERGLFEGWA